LRFISFVSVLQRVLLHKFVVFLSSEVVRGRQVAKKKAIIEKTKELMTSLPFDAHAKWQEASEQFAAFMEEWKQAGFASRKENEAIWEEFKSLRAKGETHIIEGVGRELRKMFSWMKSSNKDDYKEGSVARG